MYKDLYDEKHKLYKVDFRDPVNFESPSTGEYDRDILCLECDRDIIGKFYDDYAAKVFNQENFVQISIGNKIGPMLMNDVQNIDYTRFKLFLLSILWRAGISKRKIFSAVQLGPYLEIIRTMLYHQDPGEPSDFPCYMISLRKEVEMSKELVSPFRRDKQEFYTLYSVIIAGFLYIYRVGKNIHIPHDLESILINKSNQMKIVQIPIEDGDKFLKRFLKLGSK